METISETIGLDDLSPIAPMVSASRLPQAGERREIGRRFTQAPGKDARFMSNKEVRQ